MRTELGNLASGTIFTYNGQQYKAATGFSCSLAGLKTNYPNKQRVGEERDDKEIWIECSPKLGGQFQDNLQVYIGKKQEVTVE